MKNKEPLTPAQLRMRRLRHKAQERALIQLFFFLGMPGTFVAGFSGVKRLAGWIGTGEPLRWDSFVTVLAALCLLTMAFGRFFCGFVCAFGSFGDLVYGLSALVQKKLLHRTRPFRLPEAWICIAQKLKYLLLALIAGLSGIGVYAHLRGTSPWDVFAQLTALRLPAAGYGVGVLLLALIVVGMALHPRFFCQCLCPLGALFALLPVPSFLRLRRASEGCIKGCNACKMNCPVGIKLDEDTRGGECIACEKCVGVCPKQNIHRWDFALFKNALISPLLKAVLFALAGTALGLTRF